MAVAALKPPNEDTYGHRRIIDESTLLDSRVDNFEWLLASSPREPKNVTTEAESPSASTVHAQEAKGEELPRLIRLPRQTKPKRVVKILQQWEGVVTDVGEDSVFADIRDLTDPSNAPEFAEIFVTEISEADRPLLLTPGSVFYWSIGYEVAVGGQIRRISEIRARRIPKWSNRAIRRMTEKGQALFEQLNNAQG